LSHRALSGVLCECLHIA